MALKVTKSHHSGIHCWTHDLVQILGWTSDTKSECLKSESLRGNPHSCVVDVSLTPYGIPSGAEFLGAFTHARRFDKNRI